MLAVQLANVAYSLRQGSIQPLFLSVWAHHIRLESPNYRVGWTPRSGACRVKLAFKLPSTSRETVLRLACLLVLTHGHAMAFLGGWTSFNTSSINMNLNY